MADYHLKDLDITLEKKGAGRYAKVTYPIRYGRYTEIKAPNHLFEFTLNGDIRAIRGLREDWPQPVEWLKRTDGNDWVYYTTGAYNEVNSFLGEFYRPCLSYPSNSLWAYAPFASPGIRNALQAWSALSVELKRLSGNGAPAGLKSCLTRIAARSNSALHTRARLLHRIIGNHVTVLPPDTRHVDYQVIPVMVADGCLYRCDFCAVKTPESFKLRSMTDIDRQITALKDFYGADRANYNAVFMGNHDALAAGRQMIRMAAEKAYEAFDFQNSFIGNPTLYLFGSVDALLKAGLGTFEELNKLPFYTYVNIGLESADAATLEQIGKPLTPAKIMDAFQMMLAVNRCCHNLEITANFLLGNRFAPGHYESIIALARDGLEKVYSKGAIYLSPLPQSAEPDSMLKIFLKIKNLSRLPTYLYLIQRL